MQNITILGATGSIGVSTLDVLARHPDRYRVYALTAHNRIEELAGQCVRFNVSPESGVRTIPFTKESILILRFHFDAQSSKLP